MKKRAFALACVLVLAAVMLTAAVCARADGAEAPAFSRDWRLELQLEGDEKVCVEFSPPVSSVYELYAYPSEGGALDYAGIFCDGESVAEGAGEGVIVSAELDSERDYVLEISGEGHVLLELMRSAEGRSIRMPAALEEGGADGRILRPGNAMWFRLETKGMNAGIYVTPGRVRGIELSVEIYTEDGFPAAEAEPMPGGARRLYIAAGDEEAYLLRVSSPAGGTGSFRVEMMLTEDSQPDSVEIVTGNLVMRKGDVRSVRARTRPLDASAGIMWFSSDISVAEVSGTGVVTAVGVGTAQISAYAFGGMYAEIDVVVEPVEPEYIAYRGESLSIRVGDVLTPVKLVYPAAAADDERIVYESSDPETVSISAEGEITALREGSAVISASYGEIRAELNVYVDEAPARYRALLISVQNYAPDVNTTRAGAMNTVYNLEALLESARFGSEECAVTVEADLNSGEALAAIEKAFAGAREKDVSILYISCHGYYRDGMTIMQFRDGSELAACDLEAALRRVPGTVVVLADCCDSGGLIGEYSDTAELSGGIVSAFSGEAAAFSSSKYKVLASAALGQDSYRLGTSGDEENAVTVFARALCDALGWDIDDQRRGPLNADMDYDGRITLWEAYLYTDRRVGWYLTRAGGMYTQDVQIYPEGDMFVLFERE